MDTATIEKAIADGPEAVSRLIESEADRRVNAAVETARQKWETELPDHVDTEIQRRQEEKEQRDRLRVTVADELRERFNGTNVTEDFWNELVDIDGLISLDGEERTAAIDEATERITGTYDRIVKAAYSRGKPERGPERTSEQVFKDQLLESMNKR